ncbi:Kv channel-interacting protein 4-like isoform X3 [Varroa jacobsoni]|uniref:Kv channel-interacting protein 4-like isoform X3 n=1 Tax=Varroa jacobsoni TaxID=62625 RepID=UPI000BFA56E3|nr:Kv channel-interacting protein 4-like isoform X3 [Varroa jacobsoni]
MKTTALVSKQRLCVEPVRSSKPKEKAIDELETSSVRCKPEAIGNLCKTTKFNRDEIKRIYQGFKQTCPSGLVTEAVFKDMYCQFFPLADTTLYAHYVFRVLDKDKTGTINFKDFVQGLSILSRGSPTEKLEWVFNLYDLNRDGCITAEEMLEIVNSVYSLLGHCAQPCVDEISAKKHVSRVFLKLDFNRDGVVTSDEFVHACLKMCSVILPLIRTEPDLSWVSPTLNVFSVRGFRRDTKRSLLDPDIVRSLGVLDTVLE